MSTSSSAFGAPGIEPRWTPSAKDGIGTAYHSASRIWFTLSHGIINEIYFLHVDSPYERKSPRLKLKTARTSSIFPK